MGLSFCSMLKMIVWFDILFDLLVEQVSLSSTDVLPTLYSGCALLFPLPFIQLPLLLFYLLSTPQVLFVYLLSTPQVLSVM
jgi:hypothetical protein